MKHFSGLICWTSVRPALFHIFLLFGLFGIFCGTGIAQKLAITFDDLPLNGLLPPGVTRVETTKNVLEILKKRHVPPVYGFINAKKLEGNADGAEALKLWAAAESVGNHTYSRDRGRRTGAGITKSRIAKGRCERYLALVPLSVSSRGRHGGEAARRAGVFENARLFNRAGDSRLRRLLVEHGVCALRGEERYEVD
jgi:hypothetical protein